MMTDHRYPAGPGSPASLPLHMVGILSALIFALNFSLEFLILFRHPQVHQLLMLALLNCLALWALAESALFGRSSWQHVERRLRVLLIAQLFVELIRTALVIWPGQASNPISKISFIGSDHFLFISAYGLIFLEISRTLLKIHTAELDKAYRTIVSMEQSALKLTDAIPVGTYVLEVPTRGRPYFSFLSTRWLDMLGADRDAVMGDPAEFYKFIHPDDRANFVARNEEAIARRAAFYWEGRILTNGVIRWMSIEALPRELRDGSTVYESVMIDVTAHKEAAAALARTHEQLTHAAILESRGKEREQLLQDMHDGFGSHLSTARILAERGELRPGELADILQDCLSDLQLFADTFQTMQGSLATGLADLRFRAEQRTVHLPIKWNWLVNLDDLPDLSQRTVLHILRIVQESLNNALRHSRAGAITITAFTDTSKKVLDLSISDDGLGLPEPIRYGCGLRNMERRAREIGAELAIVRREQGTCIRLAIPLVLGHAAGDTKKGGQAFAFNVKGAA